MKRSALLVLALLAVVALAPQARATFRFVRARTVFVATPFVPTVQVLAAPLVYAQPAAVQQLVAPAVAAAAVQAAAALPQAAATVAAPVAVAQPLTAVQTFAAVPTVSLGYGIGVGRFVPTVGVRRVGVVRGRASGARRVIIRRR